MSGHTSGPWSLKEHSSKEYGEPDLCSHAVMGANELQIATVVSDCIDDFEANARLIAAAPELLEALQWMVDNDDTNEGDEPLPDHGGLTWNEINSLFIAGLNKARAAIAKATGAQA